MQKKGTILSVFCPYLKRVVTLKKAIWFGKIVAAHPEVSNRLDLIEEILSKDDTNVLKYKTKGDPGRIALFKECPHLRPHNRYIKIAVRLISGDKAIIKTVYGKNDLPSDMEEM